MIIHDDRFLRPGPDFIQNASVKGPVPLLKADKIRPEGPAYQFTNTHAREKGLYHP